MIAALLASSGLCLALVAARYLYVGVERWGFLVWNLVLAWIPFLAALAVHDGARAGRGRLRQVALAAVWLLFLPNAPYILTDFIHRDDYWGEVPRWVDLLIVSAFAWTGLLLGLVSLYLMHLVVRARVGGARSWAGVAAVLGIASFGVYLGRVHRWNSWDVLTRPRGLLADAMHPLADPLAHPRHVVAALLFSGFLALAYLVVYAFAELGAGMRRTRG